MIQIQPVYDLRTEYEVLAERQGLLFEALELSFDGVSEEKYNWYKSCGKVRSLHGAFIDVNPASGDGELAKLSEKRYEESCEKAIACKAENVVFHSTCFPFLRGYYLESWADKSAEFYTRLANKYPLLTFFIENSFDIDPCPIKELIKRTDAKNVKVCLDIGHINYSRAKQEQWFEELGEYTGYLHLSDNKGVYDDHLAIGEGSVDWKTTDRFAAMLGKNIPVTLEVGSTDGIVRSLDFIEANGYFGGLK